MARKQRLVAVILSVLMLMTIFGACKREEDMSSNTTGNPTTAAGEITQDTDSVNTGTEGTSTNEESGIITAKDKETPSTNKPKTTTKKPPNTSPTINDKVTIKQGSKRMDQDLSFGGKTFTLTLGAAPDGIMQRRISAFENKFKCKIDPKIIGYDDVLTKVAAKLASGKGYDILSLGGSLFPEAAIKNIYEPLDDAITTADLYNKSKHTLGGFDEELSKSFAWNGKIYALSSRTGMFSPGVTLIYYNKKMLNDVGAQDPYTLYKQGKWDWNALKSIGEAVTDKTNGIYLSNVRFVRSTFVLANDGLYVTGGNKPVQNLSDPKIERALKYVQELCTGNKAVIKTDDGASEPTGFFNGKYAMFMGADYNYNSNFEIGKNVKNSNAFGKNLDNLGIVPAPLGPDNKAKKNPTGWIQGTAAGKGSDKRAAVAWGKFVSYFNDPIKPEYVFSSDTQNIIDDYKFGNLVFPNHGYTDGSNGAANYITQMEFSISTGADVTQSLTSMRDLITNCIKVTLSQQ